MKPLPLDIIREIITYATDSIGPLRLVCHEWRDVVDDHYSKKKNLPKISVVYVIEKKDESIDVRVQIKRNFLPAYRLLHSIGMRKDKTKEFGGGSSVDLARRKEMVILKLSVTDEDTELRELARSFGTKIGAVFLNNAGDSDSISHIFAGRKVNKLNVIQNMFHEDYSKNILEWVQSSGVSRIFLEVDSFKMSKPREFLLSICGLVEYLHIDQGCGVFFGLPNEDWAQLITEMFAKRVSYVEIDNFDFSFLSTREQVQHVIESLCAENERNVLRVRCGYSCNASLERNDHIVKMNQKIDGPNFTIVHKTRRKDKFASKAGVQ